MRVILTLVIAALMLAIIVKVSPNVTVFDEASVYDIHFQLPAPTKVSEQK